MTHGLVTGLIAIFVFWLLGGVIGGTAMKRLITGFPSRMAVDVFAVVWGLITAVCARLLIVSFGFGTILMVITYIVGVVISGTTPKQTNSPESRVLDEMRMTTDYTYYKKEILGFMPPAVYIVASIGLFFIWK
jgi:hypothetical protein